MQHSQLRTVSVVFLLVGLLTFLLLGGIPAGYAFAASTRDFGILSGLWGSPVVGLANFRGFMGGHMFGRVFVNSFILGVVPSILAVVVAVPVAGAVGSMSAGWRRTVATIALLLPAFVPDITMAFLVQNLFSSLAFANAGSFRVIMIVLSAIRPAAVCAFVGAAAAGICKDRGQSGFTGAAAGAFVGIAVSLVRFLSGNAELQILLNNPLVMHVAETFDSYQYRQGLLMFNVSYASAAWVFRTLLQMIVALPVSAAVFFCMRGLARVQVGTSYGAAHDAGYGAGYRTGYDAEQGIGFDAEHDASYSGGYGVQAGFIPAALGAVVFVVLILLPVAYAGTYAPGMLGGAVVSSVVITVISVVVQGVLLFALAAWLCVHIKNIGAVILILVLVAIVNNTMGTFLFHQWRGVVNTYWGVGFANAFNIAYVLPLAFLAWLKNPAVDSLRGLVRAMLPYFAAFMGLFAASAWGSGFYQMVLLREMRLFGVPMFLWQAMHGRFYMISAGFILGISLPVLIIAVGTVVDFIVTNRIASAERPPIPTDLPTFEGGMDY